MTFDSAEKIEMELVGFKFKGPGLYMTKTDTVVILPRPPENPPTIKNVWAQSQPEGTVWDFNVYNCNFNDTIFAVIANIATRQDER